MDLSSKSEQEMYGNHQQITLNSSIEKHAIDEKY
jgi:hypothetical protein